MMDTPSKDWYFAFTVKCLSGSFFRTAKSPRVGTEKLVCLYQEKTIFFSLGIFGFGGKEWPSNTQIVLIQI